MVNNKLMFISYLRQNTISDNVNDLANIFEFALERDPDLYSALLQIKGEIEKHPSPLFHARIKKIKDAYNGLCPIESLYVKSTYQIPKKV